jgi:hypothetical protein
VTILSGVAEPPGFDAAEALRRTVARGGPGPWRQARDILWLMLRGGGFSIADYYDFALWRRDAPRDPRAEFVPAGRLRAFNDALRMPGRGPETRALTDKLRAEAALLARGLPVVQSLAAFAPPGSPPLPGHVRALPDAPALAAFLAAPPVLPLFGKPRRDQSCHGACAVAAVSADGMTLTLADGRDVPAAALAAEIAAGWPEGYVFQPCLATHPDLARHTGAAPASLRITTLLTADGAEPWYSVLYLPPKGAMHVGRSRLWGTVDLASGRVETLRHVRDPAGPPPRHALDPDTPLLGTPLPDWPAARAAALAAHQGYPGHGILGWDLLVTDRGPVLLEGNPHPGAVWQNITLRGLGAPPMRALWDRARAHAAAVNGTGPSPAKRRPPAWVT